MVDYITKDDIIIFSPNYNDIIDIKLLSNYKQIIFSFFVLQDDLFDAYANKNFKNQKLFNSTNAKCFHNCFNQKIEFPPNITHITFGHDFNQLVVLPQNLIHLIFSNRYNQSVVLQIGRAHV